MNLATSRFSAILKRARPSIWPSASQKTATNWASPFTAISLSAYPEKRAKPFETLLNSAKKLDVETIQVSIAHAFPGTEFYDYAKKNNLVSIKMADDEGHQLPNVIYPGILDKGEMVEWVERFYGEYYFRPKAAWRIVRKSLFDNHERKRLYKEAKDYLSLRAKRKKYVAEQKADRLAAAERA